MADNSSSQSPQKPMQTPSQSMPDQMPTPISNPNSSHNMASPAMVGSPSINDLSQQGQVDASHSSVTLDYAQKQSNLMASNSGFQMNQLQRSNSMQRLNQMQQLQQNQQFGGAGMSAAALRMYGGSGQMNFGGGAQQQQQLMSRAGMMGQVGQLPMLPGQTAAHFGLQSQIMGQQRQKSMIQGTQFNPASVVQQPLASMQTMGMMSQMNTLGMNQIRANGPLSYAQNQRFTQMRPQQQISNQTVLTSPQLTGPSLTRASSLSGMNQQMTGLPQNGQPIQMTLPQQQQQQQLQSQQFQAQQLQTQQMQPSQQQLLKQVQQQQQQAFIMQQLSQQKQQQQHQQLHQLQLHHQQQQQQQQQQSPRLVGSPLQRTASLTGSQQETNPASSGNTSMGLANQGPESSNYVPGKRKISDIVSQVDPSVKLDSYTEDFLLDVADGFLESVASFACNLAKHRKSSTLEPKDLLLPIEKTWQLTVPGYSRAEKKQKTSVPTADTHKRRMEMVKLFMDQGGGRPMPMMNKPIAMVDDMASEHGMLRTSGSAEGQFSMPAVGVMQKVTRF